MCEGPFHRPIECQKRHRRAPACDRLAHQSRQDLVRRRHEVGPDQRAARAGPAGNRGRAGRLRPARDELPTITQAVSGPQIVARAASEREIVGGGQLSGLFTGSTVLSTIVQTSGTTIPYRSATALLSRVVFWAV